jgi:hypothetical protein
MAGLIGTGLDYQRNALGGFVRESAEQQQIDEANTRLKAERRAQKATMGAEGAVIGGLGGWYAGASIGAIGGPAGMLIGAGVGYLFSQLF